MSLLEVIRAGLASEPAHTFSVTPPVQKAVSTISGGTNNSNNLPLPIIVRGQAYWFDEFWGAITATAAQAIADISLLLQDSLGNNIKSLGTPLPTTVAALAAGGTVSIYFPPVAMTTFEDLAAYVRQAGAGSLGNTPLRVQLRVDGSVSTTTVFWGFKVRVITGLQEGS